MKIYKYRDLSVISEKDLDRLYQIILQKKIWCAKPDDLNDKDEFSFQCDYTPTPLTIPLLTKILIQYGKTFSASNPQLLNTMVNSKYLKDIATPIIDELINNSRKTIGVACFSTLKDDNILWTRYGGCGEGLCIEIDFPDNLLNRILFNVTYVSKKVFHIDSIFESDLYEDKRINAYRNILLTKTDKWIEENEVRIITKKQDIQMIIDGSISEIIFGKQLQPEIISTIKTAINDNLNSHSIKFIEMGKSI